MNLPLTKLTLAAAVVAATATVAAASGPADGSSPAAPAESPAREAAARAPAARAPAERLTLRPTADAYVRADARRGNFGRLRTLRAGPRPLTRSFLRFSVRGFTGYVQSAALRVWVRSPSRGTIAVRAVGAAAWSELRLTFGAAPRPGRAVGSARAVAGRWVTVDVTRAVTRRGAVTLAITSASRGGVAVASRETGARAPRLLVGVGTVPPVPPPPPGAAATLVAAGDIAYGGSGDDQTAALLDEIDPTVIVTMGDNAYDSGTTEEFAKWYDPTWGRHKAKTRPTPGNHEYKTPNASGYFDYFGAAAGERGKGWYSFDVGAWHLVALNTNGPDACEVISCSVGSEQERWLRADLAATAKRCVIAYFHHPRFSRGPHGDDSGVSALWQALYDHGVELVLQGHDHNYQRWAPLTPAGTRDDARGIRSFVVGTGGKNLYAVGSSSNLEAAQGDTLGVLELTLRESGYDWAFVPVAGKTYTDSGSASCR